MRIAWSRFAPLALVLCLPGASHAQGSLWEGYTKREVMIPMRDGTRLYTAIYVPTKPSNSPFLIERTPYSAGPYGTTKPRWWEQVDLYSRALKAKYILVVQDVRGRYKSEGSFSAMRNQLIHKTGPKDTDESTDTFDTIDYLVKNIPGNNGRAGLWGISYPGGYAALGAISRHPALKISSPQAPTANWFIGDDEHHNGAMFIQDNFEFENWFGGHKNGPDVNGKQTFTDDPITEIKYDDAYKFYLGVGALKNFDTQFFKGRSPHWNELNFHDTYDEFWQSRDVPSQMKDIRCAVFTVGGWFDAEDLWGALNVHAATTKQNPKQDTYLVMGPWSHGQWMDNASGLARMKWGSDTGKSYRDRFEWPILDAYLRGDGKPKVAKVNVFQTGANQWRAFPSWPPPGAKSRSIFLAGEKLSWTKPSGSSERSYTSDPANPVPYEGGTLRGRSASYMVADQRFATARPDVLTYRIKLTEDLTLAGPIDVDLKVKTTGTDSDFVVKIIDGYPSNDPQHPGGEMLLRADIFRGKFRKSFVTPFPFIPGQADQVKFQLNDCCHTFKKGHELVVQVQSSWFPLVDRNPQKFGNIWLMSDSDYTKATISILGGSELKLTTINK